MPRSKTHKAIINLLLVIMLMQPVLVIGQHITGTMDSADPLAQMTIMECCDTTLAGTNGYPEQDMACSDMAPADCAFAVNQGGCGNLQSVLAPEKAVVPIQSSSDHTCIPLHAGYLSVVLDTLTPPPNSSKD